MRRMRQLAAIAWAMLREVFGESAYLRFLARTHLASSAESYAEFLRESDAAKSRGLRCC